MTGYQALDITLVIALMGGIWMVTFFLLAELTGWKSLSRRFPAIPPGPDAERGFGSISIGGWGNYNNCVRWASDHDRLHLRILPGFNLFHPPISIPWGEVETIVRIEKGIRRGWATLHIGPTRLTVPGRAARRELDVRDQIARREAGESEVFEPEAIARVD